MSILNTSMLVASESHDQQTWAGLQKPSADFDFSDFLDPANWKTNSSEGSSGSVRVSPSQELPSSEVTFGAEDVSKAVYEVFKRLNQTPHLSKDSLKELRGEIALLSPKFECFKKATSAHKLFEALIDRSSLSSGFSSPQQSSPIHLIQPLRSDQGRIDQKVQKFIVLDCIGENLKKAGDFLAFPCEDSQQVALATLKGLNPLSSDSSRLGEGGCGVVTRRNVLGKEVAAKTLKSLSRTIFTRETRVSMQLKHPNLINTYLIDEKEQIFFLELAEKGSLKKYLSQDPEFPLTQKEFRTILSGISSGLSYMHQNGFYHGDVKADNILLTETKQAKVSDFGTSKPFAEFNPTAETEGTVFYLPPEYLIGTSTQENCSKIDVWGFGMLLWQQLKQAKFITPFIGENTPGNDTRILGGFRNSLSFTCYVGANFTGFEEGFLDQQLDPVKCATYDPDGSLVALMKRCFAYNPADRPTMEEIHARTS